MPTCQICGLSHNVVISAKHIKSHGLTTQEYKAQFPSHPLRIQSTASREKIAANKSNKPAWNKGIKTGPNEKLSLSKKGKPSKQKGMKRTEEQCQRIATATREAMKNGLSEEAKQKIAANTARRKMLGTFIAPMLGKKHTDEVKNKIKSSLAKTNSKKSAEIIDAFATIASQQNITFEKVEDNYWIHMHCLTCDSKFINSRQVFRSSTKGGADLCLTCNPRLSGRSSAEKELFNFVKSLDTEATANDRSLLGGKEIDVLVPSKNIGFEFTGLYWHAEKQNPERNHLLWKQQFAHNRGVRLITIFEDEWALKRPIVESRIRGLLGYHCETIDARKTQIREISARESREFLDANHIQGADKASVKLGLFFNGELVEIATFKKTNMTKGGDGSEWELSRLCSKLNIRVRGGAGKLIAHFQRHVNTDNIPLISFADRRWSDGSLYETLGFKFVGSTPPSYWYMEHYKTRIHRSALMKHRLVETDADKKFTEWELAQKRGFDRIWDCGTTKWILPHIIQ